MLTYTLLYNYIMCFFVFLLALMILAVILMSLNATCRDDCGVLLLGVAYEFNQSFMVMTHDITHPYLS